MEKLKFTRGERVWSRVQYPHQWWPGVVIRQDFLGVLVSFFDCESPRCFIESEVVSFEAGFKSLVHKCTNHVLLNRALKLSGRYVLATLKRRRNATDLVLFQPRVVLGFVRSVAVSPWVDVADYLNAANAFAQFTAFRRHLISLASGVQADPASEAKQLLDVAELDDLEMVDDCQEFSKKAEDNFPACLINRNINNLLSEESLSHWDRDQLEIRFTSQTEQWKIHRPFQEMVVKLQILALDPFYLDGECLNTFKSNFMSFRSFSYENCSNNSCKKCCPIEWDEAQHFNPGYKPSIKVLGEKEKTTLPLVPYVESLINCPGLKRQLDQSSVSEPPLKLRKTLSFSISRPDAYRWRSNQGLDAVVSATCISGYAFSSFYELFNTIPLSSIEAYAYLLRNITGCEPDLFKSFFSGSQLDLKTQSLSAIVAQSSASICSSSLKELVLNLVSFFSVKHTSCSSNQNIVKSYRVKHPLEIADTFDNCETHISHVNVQQPEDCGPLVENHGTLISYADDTTEKLMQPPAAQSMSNNAIETHADDTTEKLMQPPAAQSMSNNAIETHAAVNKASDVNRGTSNYQLHSHLTADELKMMSCSSDDSNSVKLNRERSMEVASKYSFKKHKKLPQPVTSALAVKANVGQRSEVQTSLAISRSLLMKFPKDFILPSKEELVKKFSPFGIVDCLNTKVYFYSGSARVVFLHQLDAMAAYQYAKRKKIAFGKANVKFWLDPSQDKRGTNNLVFSSPCTAELPGFNLRSCLKKSRVLETEGKRCPKKVRFLMET